MVCLQQKRNVTNSIRYLNRIKQLLPEVQKTVKEYRTRVVAGSAATYSPTKKKLYCPGTEG